MTCTDIAASALPAPPPLSGRIVADAALIAELALTFDLDVLVAETEHDPFRR